MLEEIRAAVIRSGHTYAVIARKAGVSYNTVKGIMGTDANPTIDTIGAIHRAITELPNKAGRGCHGCKFNEGQDPPAGDGMICAAKGRMVEQQSGCAMRCPV